MCFQKMLQDSGLSFVPSFHCTDKESSVANLLTVIGCIGTDAEAEVWQDGHVEIILRTKIQRIRVVSSALWSLTCWVQFIAVMDVDILKSVFNNLWRHLWWP